jgi:hypothetical protein
VNQDGLPELWPWSPEKHRERLTAAPVFDDYDLRTVAAAGELIGEPH